jgi:hypothetical protein
MNKTLADLQNWFLSQCNGEWEHSRGLSIGTLDNPGWAVEVDLSDTPWEKTVWENLSFDNGEHDWVHCTKKDAEFKGYGDGNKLEFILNHFLNRVGEGRSSAP